MDLTAMLGASFVGAFLYAFTTLLPVINPFSGAMFFVTLTGHLSDADRSYVAGRIAVFSLIILMVCLFAGNTSNPPDSLCRTTSLKDFSPNSS
jgi:multiple antibiotic resistance protein